MNQKTIKNIATISGVGIHTGFHTNLTLVPAEANTGIRFIRTDLEGKPTIPANVDYVFSTKRSTNLKIKNLTGIEDFDSLKNLNCSRNKLTSLDISNNILLTEIILKYV